MTKQSLFSLGLCAAALLIPSASHAQQPDPLVSNTTALIDRFISEARRCGFEPPYVPGVVVDSSPSIVSFNTRDRSVYISRWADSSGFVRELVTAWAEAGTLGLTPEEQFAEIFNSLLVPHELGHFVQIVDGRDATQDLWSAEVDANRFAIAFWSLDPEERARIQQRVENFTGFLSALPNPVPAGEDPHAYFEANYERLSNDPMAYGWYQGAFMATAWAQRDETDFCGLIKPRQDAGA